MKLKKITREVAREAGLVHYYTGIPCIHGHVAQRYVKGNSCIECHSIQRKKYYEQNMATGYRRSRPRIDEPPRPSSPNAILTANYRKKRIAEDPAYKEKLAKYARDWRARNLERSNEISREAYRRQKIRENGGEVPIRSYSRGAETYVPKKPCKYGHALRYVTSKNCVECTRRQNAAKRDKV